jgi:hypothetical protein
VSISAINNIQEHVMVLLLRQDDFLPETEGEEAIQKLNAIRYDYKSNGG